VTQSSTGSVKVNASHVMISIKDVRKSYGEKPALRGVSLDVVRGECLGLLGPNGAGKTTLIRSLVARVALEAGTISVDGAAPGSAEARAKLGYIPQELALYPLLTARENLLTFGSYQGMSGAALRESVEWCLQWAALSDRQKEPIKGFSGGMKRRLNMACGLIHRPKVVLMDEPTVGVDPQSRERIYEMIEALRKGGTSVVYTTHYMEEAQRLCDRVAIIDHGQLIAIGTVAELIANAFGTKQQVEVRFLRPPSSALEEWIARRGGTSSEASATFAIEDAAKQVPELLTGLAAQGAAVGELSVKSPTLESVFLKITGRELRD
jgi:ABC-2 type transport system ATP-binding protein